MHPPQLMSSHEALGNSQRFVDAVGTSMREVVGRHRGPAVDAALHAIDAGGKRLRPLLVYAARPCHVASASWERTGIACGAAVELIHTATLIHDDMLDDADMRRGRSTTHTAWNARVATAAGDLLFACAFRLLVEIRDHAGEHTAMQAVHTLADVARQLAEGEALQAEQTADPTISLDAYRERCIAKTGVLFGAALRLGALAGDTPLVDLDVIDEFGRLVGFAFQIADDLLDLGTEQSLAQLGKRPGADIRDGTITAPMLFACEADPALRELLRAPSPDVDNILARIRATNGLARAHQLALDVVEQADQLLVQLRGRFDEDALRAIATTAVDRIS